MRKCKEPFTAEYLKTVLHYNPETGQFTWCKGWKKGQEAGFLNPQGYVSISVKTSAELGSGSTSVLAHRLAVLYMTGEWPKGQVDHVFGIRDDNRWANLEDKTQSENMLGHRTQGNTVSGVRGVSWCAKGKCWQASHTVKGIVHYLGLFNTVDEAEAALIASRKGLPKPIRKDYQYRVARKQQEGKRRWEELVRKTKLSGAAARKVAEDKWNAVIADCLANHTLLPKGVSPKSFE